MNFILVLLLFVVLSVIVAIGIAIVLWIARKLDKRQTNKTSTRQAGKLSNRAKD